MSWLLDGRPLNRILVTRLRYLGDVVMSTVVLDVLRRGDPDVKLGYLCEAEHGTVLNGHPHLERLHLLASRRRGTDARARRRSGSSQSAGRSFWGTVADLRSAHYDLAVDLFFNPRSAWLLRLGGPARRIGGTLGSRRHLYTHTARPEDLAAEAVAGTPLAQGGVGHHLSRLAPLLHGESGLPFTDWLAKAVPDKLAPRIVAPDLSSETVAALSGLGLTPAGDFAVLAPGATWPSKEWPDDRWAGLARHLGRRLELKPVVVVPPGRSADWPVLASAAADCGGGVLPPLALEQVLAVLSAGRCLVSVDGGVMHAGVGLGVPTVGIFGPTPSDIWFPYTGCGPFRVVALKPDCHPCHRHTCDDFICLPDLAHDRVGEAVEAVLDSDGKP